jgi:hypothetical protein
MQTNGERRDLKKLERLKQPVAEMFKGGGERERDVED